MNKLKTLNISLILGIFLFINIQAQNEINKEVRVIKPYVPTLSDANKINLLPDFTDTTKVYADFSYEISPKRFPTNFRLKPITPAKMKGLPLKKLYKSQLSLGLGNYFTPYAELTVNQLRDRKTAVGVYVKHHSSAGKIKLENDIKVPAGFSDNDLSLYGRKMLSRSVVEGVINAGYNSSLFYGYNPVIDTTLEKDSIRQKIYTVGAKIDYYSSNPDSTHFNYKTGIEYQFLSDHYEFQEQAIKVDAAFGKVFGDWYTNLETGIELYKRNAEIDTTNNSIVKLNPSVSKATDEWRFILGINSAFDTKNGETNMFIYPRVDFQFNIVKNVLIPYMGLTGFREINSYRSALNENPFINPGTIIENSSHSLIAYFGLKGRYSKRMAFDFRLKYSTVDSMHFFVHNTADTLRNSFGVEYDDGNVLNVGGEVTWNHTDKLKFILRADYYKYNLDQLEFAWHKPAFKASLNTSYNLRNKILIDANLFFTGKRNILNYNDYSLPAESMELKSYIDANLSAEYRYTSMLSFFIRLNNLSASGYQIWYNYPVQRFQALIGFSYAL